MLETIGQKTGERKGAKQTRARRARHRALADGLQNGIRLQHRAHGAVHIPGSYSTTQCPTAPGLLTCHSTARTAQCAPRGAMTRYSTPWYLQHGAHGARSAHGTGHTPGGFSSAGCASVKGQCTRKTEHIRGQSTLGTVGTHKGQRRTEHTSTNIAH